MATDEEYLDNLLKSITEKEVQPQTVEEIMPSGEDSISDTTILPEEDLIPDSVVLPEDDLIPDSVVLPEDDLLSADSMISDEESSFGDEMLPDENASFEDDLSSMTTASNSDDEEWMTDLKNLMGNNTIPEDDSDLAASINDMNDMDIEDLLSGMGDMDDELEEISGLLKHADNNESVDTDMLALLEGIGSGSESEDLPDSYAALLDDNINEETEGKNGQTEEEIPSKTKKKRIKKEKAEKKRRFFGKKKDVAPAESEEEIPTEIVVPYEAAETVIEQATGEMETVSSEETAIQEETGEKSKEGAGQESSGDNIEPEEAASGTESAENSEQEQEPKEKKPGFFVRLMNALTQEEEDVENVSEENKEILNELEEEDKKDGKKKEKKGKKGGKKKKGKEEEAEGEEDEAAEDANAKKKKPKKEKKPKEDKPKEKTVKVLSKRNLLVLVAFCATIVGSIILLSFFLPEYADKKSARNAYNAGDYESVYTLLYDRNLNSSDLLIFNRAATIRKMERRIESYENNLAMGRELEALDSLLKGVACYQTLTEADEFGVRQEVEVLYQQICSILDENYGITIEDAMEINTYDSETYTRRLYSAVYGKSFTRPGEGSAQGEEPQEETNEPSQPQDVLADEEEIITY